MPVIIRNPNVVALFPLQEVIFDKDGTGPLASGVVSFFRDPDFTVPKDVYEETLNPISGVTTYTNLGNVLILSGIGSFVDGVGNNFIPLLYPFTGSPADSAVGLFQPYFITVYSSVGVFQFSSSDWPPNSFSEAGGATFQEALSSNLLSNPQFSIVSFDTDASESTYVYNVSGTKSNILAPGWTINSVGTGTITVSRVNISFAIPSESPYAINIAWSTGFTSLNIVQQLTNSPRILAGDNASASIVAQCPSSQAIGLQLHYITGDTIPIDITVAEGTTTGDLDYNTISGTQLIPTTSTQSPSGFVDFVIEIGSLTLASSVTITSAQLVEVAGDNIIAAYTPQTTQQNLNGLMWYYEPQLAYKPIPSYAIGWNYPFNPCQEFGLTHAAFTLSGTNLAKYLIDQTILFQSVDSSIGYTVSKTGLALTTAHASSFSLFTYFDANTSVEMLNQRMAVMLKGFITDANPALNLIGNIQLLWTTNSALPILPLAPYASITVTAGIPSVTTLTSGWLEVPRSGLGAAAFTLGQTASAFNFNYWDGTAVASINTAKGFCLVVSFGVMPTSTTLNLDYITLCGGDIATPPVAANESQTLSALQYYYETTYNYGSAVGSATNVGIVECAQTVTTSGGNTSLFAKTFGFTFNGIKRTTPAISLYSEAGTVSRVSGFSAYAYNAVTSATDVDVINWMTLNIGQKAVSTSPANNNPLVNNATGTVQSTSEAWIAFHYVADARFGIV